MGKTKQPVVSPQLQRRPATTPKVTPRPAAPQTVARRPQPAGPAVQRTTCACGGALGADGQCAACRERKAAAVQRKMAVNAPGDAHEQEADQVARAHLQRQADETAAGPTAAPIQRKLDEAKPVQRKLDETTPVQRQMDDETETASIQRQGAGAAVPEVTPEIESGIEGARGGGSALPAGVQRSMENTMGADLSGVRVHSDGRADRLSRQLDARAFTSGQDIFFKQGEYNPGSRGGEELLAHEMAHTVQQGGANGKLAKSPEPGTTKAPEITGGTRSAEFLKEGWVDVNQLGIIYKEGPEGKGGANLRKTPDGEVDTWLPQNTKVYILKRHAGRRWYAVSSVSERGSRFGYVADWLVALGLPDPDANIVKVEPGQSPIEIAGKHYTGKGFDVWGKDKRYVVNALVWVNSQAKHNFPGESGISKERVDATWFTAKSTAGVYIWLPGVAHMNAIYENVAEHGGGTGSLTADLWRAVKKVYEYVAYGVAFVGGIVHGFVKSIVDAIVGLVETVVDILVSIFTGSVVSDVKELLEIISNLTWEDIKNALSEWASKWEKKLKSDSPWVAGHAHGYLTGYIMAEAAQLLLTGGAAAAAKAALWGSRLGKAIKATRVYRAFAKGLEKAGEVGSATRKLVKQTGEALRHSKPFQTLVEARAWAATAMRLAGDTLMDLTLEGLNRLRMLSDAALERISRLSNKAKRWLLGCASECKVNLDKIKKTLLEMTDEDIEKALSSIDPMKHPPTKADEVKKPKKSKKSPFIPLDVENVVKEAMLRLKKQGVKGLNPSEYGTKLHAAVNKVITEQTGKAATGWLVGSEKRLGDIVKLRPENAALTVREYMAKWGMQDRYPSLSKDLLDTKIQDLKPDLFVRSPNGRSLVWDVTSQPDKLHMAKTMLYSDIIGREMGGFLRISESYWRTIF